MGHHFDHGDHHGHDDHDDHHHGHHKAHKQVYDPLNDPREQLDPYVGFKSVTSITQRKIVDGEYVPAPGEAAGDDDE